MVVFTLLLNRVHVFANFMFLILTKTHGSERVKTKPSLDNRISYINIMTAPVAPVSVAEEKTTKQSNMNCSFMVCCAGHLNITTCYNSNHMVPLQYQPQLQYYKIK